MFRIFAALLVLSRGAVIRWRRDGPAAAAHRRIRVVRGGAMAQGAPEHADIDLLRSLPRGGLKFLTAASRDPVASANSTREWLAGLGVEGAEWIPVYGENCAERVADPTYVRMVEEADAIYIGGGQSGRVSSCLFGKSSPSGVDGGVATPLLQALQSKALVLGSGAGAVALPAGHLLVTGHSAESYEAVRQGSVFHRDNGNRLLSHAQAVDTHFSERGRQGRLLVLAAQAQQRYAFGVDEGTAYLWRPSGDYEVTGKGGVAVLFEAAGSDAAQRARLHYLTRGDKIRISDGRITYSQDKSVCSTDTVPDGSNAIFNGNRTDTYKQIATAAAKAPLGSRVDSYHGQPAVQVTFINTEDTVAMCGPSGTSFENLEVHQYRDAKKSFVNLEKPNVDQHHVYLEDED